MWRRGGVVGRARQAAGRKGCVRVNHSRLIGGVREAGDTGELVCLCGWCWLAVPAKGSVGWKRRPLALGWSE